jgi:hypothetical protein
VFFVLAAEAVSHTYTHTHHRYSCPVVERRLSLTHTHNNNRWYSLVPAERRSATHTHTHTHRYFVPGAETAHTHTHSVGILVLGDVAYTRVKKFGNPSLEPYPSVLARMLQGYWGY